MNRTKLENLIHHVFKAARIEIENLDPFRRKMTPKAWLLVPIFATKEAVELIKDGRISSYRYAPRQLQLVFKSDPRMSSKWPAALPAEVSSADKADCHMCSRFPELRSDFCLMAKLLIPKNRFVVHRPPMSCNPAV